MIWLPKRPSSRETREWLAQLRDDQEWDAPGGWTEADADLPGNPADGQLSGSPLGAQEPGDHTAPRLPGGPAGAQVVGYFPGAGLPDGQPDAPARGDRAGAGVTGSPAGLQVPGKPAPGNLPDGSGDGGPAWVGWLGNVQGNERGAARWPQYPEPIAAGVARRRGDPLSRPIQATVRAVIGDELRRPAVWCQLPPCVSRHADPESLGEADARARAVSAGGAKSLI